MRKPVTLSDEAYKLLAANRSHSKESLSSVIMRIVPRPDRSFETLEKQLDQADGPLNVDFVALERARERKPKAMRN
jgi:predicted CopG family antitoxin